jgi:hypothetical protein
MEPPSAPLAQTAACPASLQAGAPVRKNMENTINLSVTPFQAILALAFQVWMIVFPILLIRKINYLTDLLHEHLDEHTSKPPNP